MVQQRTRRHDTALAWWGATWEISRHTEILKKIATNERVVGAEFERRICYSGKAQRMGELSH